MVSPSGLHCNVFFHSVVLPIQRSKRSRSWRFWIFSARLVTSHWAARGRADHPLFIQMTRRQGSQMRGLWPPLPPCGSFGVKGSSSRRSSRWWAGNIITDSSALTAAGRSLRQYVDLTWSLQNALLSKFTQQLITMATKGFVLWCSSVPQGGPEDVPQRAPLAVHRFSIFTLIKAVCNVGESH